jgi:hypothetical protein
MGQTTFANSRGIAQKGSGKTLAVFPDVCLSPPEGGGAPVPIPYANLLDAQAAAGDKKAKKDQKKLIDDAAKNGYEVKSATQWAIKSSGDEASRVGGVVSSTTTGKAKFVDYSMDVKFEGKSVVRMTDTVLQNRR